MCVQQSQAGKYFPLLLLQSFLVIEATMSGIVDNNDEISAAPAKTPPTDVAKQKPFSVNNQHSRGR